MIRNLRKNWKNRPDSEHEQAVVRVLVGLLVSFYVLLVVWRSEGSIEVFSLTVIISFFVISFVIIVWIIFIPGVNVLRRVLGCFLDNISATALLFLNGTLAAPIFIVFLWVTFGNGFRYGKNYLYLSMILSVTGFGTVWMLADDWEVGKAVNIGLFVGLIALPLYVVALLGRLETALKKAEVSSQAKSNFLATMSHEIRTPLNGMIGLINLLDRTNLASKQRHYVDLLESSSNWLLNILSDGLDYTKIEADELIIEAFPVNMKKIVSDICDVYEEVASEKGLTFEGDIDQLESCVVICDKNRLIQVFNNLLNNAFKFTVEGKVVFRAVSHYCNNNKKRFSFSVHDSGIGIERDNFEKIFSPFKQITSKNTDTVSGAGLGLAISSRLVSIMGGEIAVESEPGVGSIFSFDLKLAVVSEREFSSQDEGTAEMKWKRKPLILLVEDNPVNQEVAEAYFELLGCITTIASNGVEAIKFVTEERFDLIFMDCQMPEINGYEATRKIRELETGGLENTIVALTAHITEKDRKECFDAGMDDYVGKPYSLGILRSVLGKWLTHLHLPSDESVSLEYEKNENTPPGASEKPTIDRQLGHELRNSLNLIIGGIQLARISVENPEKCLNHLTTALKASHELTDILNQQKATQPD